MSLNSYADFFDTTSGSFEVPAGYHATVSISPVVYSTTDFYRALPISIRRCRYADEKPDADFMFRHYTEKGCRFECMLKRASKAKGCQPWDFPRADGDGEMPMCDGVASNYPFGGFAMQMEDGRGIMECIKVRMKYVTSTEAL